MNKEEFIDKINSINIELVLKSPNIIRYGTVRYLSNQISYKSLFLDIKRHIEYFPRHNNWKLYICIKPVENYTYFYLDHVNKRYKLTKNDDRKRNVRKIVRTT